MARHATKRPRELALEVFALDKAVSPSDIEKHVGDKYSSKYICQLRKRGFVFEVKKEGRNIVSYTLTKEPKNASEIRVGTKKQKTAKVKTAKAPSKKVVKAPVVTKTKVEAPEGSNLAKIKAIAEKRKAAAVPTSMPVSSVTVDADFDEVTDVRSLL